MGDQPKIIIDEDWKSQVESERESLQAAASDTPPAPDETDPEMPPASLELLLTTLATEAMMALGHLPHPTTGEATRRPNHAQYLIDTIEVLKEKTAGNLTAEESQAIEGLLHQLKMAFVAGPPAPVDH